MEFFTFDFLTPSEADFVGGVREQLLLSGWEVFVARPSQATVWFPTPYGRTAPDLIAQAGTDILVLEAKRRPAALFRASGKALSDYDAMSFLASSAECQAQLLHKLEGWLRPRDDQERPELIHSGLVAGGRFSSEHEKRARGLVLLTLIGQDLQDETFAHTERYGHNEWLKR